MVMTQKTTRQVLRFLAAGCVAVGTDLCTYTLLLHWLTPTFAKGISFLLGTLSAYILNKYWTFEAGRRPMHDMVKFVILYGFTFCVNVVANKLVLETSHAQMSTAFLAATATSTVLNFIGQKFWVFKNA